jgi:spore germination cell wall hydrolase CwlJ-like protein
MKTLLTATIVVGMASSANSASSGVSVNHCLKPGVKFVNECLSNALKKLEPKVPVPKPKAPIVAVAQKPAPKKAEPKKTFAITKNDVKEGGRAIMAMTSSEDIRCLAYSIFREAGNQKETDQYAVGQVHINRLKEGSWGKTMCKVVHSKAQFSWTLESKVVKWSKRQEEHFTQMAEGLLIDGVYVKKLASNKILHYHATYVKPKWAKQGQLVASAGDHIFYKNVPY